MDHYRHAGAGVSSEEVWDQVEERIESPRSAPITHLLNPTVALLLLDIAMHCPAIAPAPMRGGVQVRAAPGHLVQATRTSSGSREGRKRSLSISSRNHECRVRGRTHPNVGLLARHA